RQSENKDFLGMGILVGKEDFFSFGSLPSGGADIQDTYIVSQSVKKDKPLYFRFYTAWEKTDPGFASPEYFTSMLKREADKFSHPVSVKW
ncbi:MAG TPA: DUF4861 family protein, partial [Puia sp.]|nr:DUF4861 family protein [Puia sp.]